MRRWVRGGHGWLVAALLVGLVNPALAADWPSPVANDVLPYPTSGLTHGPMLGQPASDGVRIWLRTDQPREFAVVYATQVPLTADSPSVRTAAPPSPLAPALRVETAVKPPE